MHYFSYINRRYSFFLIHLMFRIQEVIPRELHHEFAFLFINLHKNMSRIFNLRYTEIYITLFQNEICSWASFIDRVFSCDVTPTKLILYLPPPWGLALG